MPKKQSGFEPLSDEWKICTHPEHNPPTHICIPQGKQYRHICPACGVEQILRPPQISYGA